MKKTLKIFLQIALILSGLTTAVNAQQTKIMGDLKKAGHAPVNDINMYYEVYGEGTVPLVLIHGGGSTIETSFGNLLPLLKGCYVIAVELQAHGRTTDRNAPETFEQDADDVNALMKYLHIQKADFLGFSNGGTTTLQMASRYPAVVHKIVIISGAYQREGFMEGFFDGMKSATLDNMPGPLKTAFLKVTPSQTGLQAMFDKDKNRMINFEDMNDDQLSAIKAPTLFMVADQDVVTVAHTQKMAKLVSRSSLIVLPGYHGAFMGEICTVKEGSKLPEVTATLVKEFLKL